ncbi:AAA family ATPase, partial [Faecalibacillus intestinalis]|uniref:AAA family ATPase n=1 Tax=Faecalibacillus intestinalis TaxID=1982626 RepID=UPI002FDAEE39
MIKDYLKENQPLFYRIIENEFNLKKIPHAFLLVGNNTDQPLQFLTMSLICNETLACEQCIDCQKVLNHQYADIIEIDGEEESIKKKHIENIQETFKKSSLEGKAKVYILKNVEKTTKEAMNALLKILEEPTEGIYAIFTTKNINRILPTIISRCQVIELKPDNKEVLKEKFELLKDMKKKKIISRCQVIELKPDNKEVLKEKFELLKDMKKKKQVSY